MRRRVVILVLIVAILIIAGCGPLPPLLSSAVDRPAVASDGSGGAIVVYEVYKGNNERRFYAQRISSNGEPLWGQRGTLLGSGFKRGGSYFNLKIVSDDSGGAIICWCACPSEPNWRLPGPERRVKFVAHITKVDSEGNIRWQREIPPGFGHWPYTLISDGLGGVIIAPSDWGRKLNLLKIDSKGDFSWGGEGISISFRFNTYGDIRVVSDGLGGAIIVQPTAKQGIFVQRINSEGNILWGQNGIHLCAEPEEYYIEKGRAVSDGSGGAIIIWVKRAIGVHNGKLPSGEIPIQGVYAQKVDAKGNILWGKEGVPVVLRKGGEKSPENPEVTGDGSGGAIITWWDCKGANFRIWAQRVDSEGKILWGENGVKVAEDISPGSPKFSIVSDGSGGAIIVSWWGVYLIEGFQAQRIDATGKLRWPAGGVLVSIGIEDGSCTSPVISEDGQGGVLIAWGVGPILYSPEKSYAQRINAEGKRMWGEKGILLTPQD